jgi:hypothetical protein
VCGRGGDVAGAVTRNSLFEFEVREKIRPSRLGPTRVTAVVTVMVGPGSIEKRAKCKVQCWKVKKEMHELARPDGDKEKDRAVNHIFVGE